MTAGQLLDRVLARMAVISDAPAARATDDSVQIAGSKSEGGAPPGFSETTGARLDVTMAEEWDDRARRFVEEAERDLGRYTNGGLVPGRSREGLEARILNVYEGVASNRVCAIEDVSESYVHKVRKRNGYYASDGRPDPHYTRED